MLSGKKLFPKIFITKKKFFFSLNFSSHSHQFFAREGEVREERKREKSRGLRARIWKKSKRDDRKLSRGAVRTAVHGSEVSEVGGRLELRGSGGRGGSNVKSTAQSCRRGAILRAKGRRLPDVWKGSRAIIEGKKGLCGFIGATAALVTI